jgi:iron donor protein CyaY
MSIENAFSCQKGFLFWTFTLQAIVGVFLTGRRVRDTDVQVGHQGKALHPNFALATLISMLDEEEFRRRADHAVESLKQGLIAEEAEGGFEVEENNGVLHVVFEEPAGKFVITPNTPVRQIWISALSTSFKLDWDAASAQFVLLKTGESLQPLTARLIQQQLES